MAGQLDTALSLYSNALNLRSQRSNMLASNLANADTPHYRAQDFNFHKTLREVYAQDKGQMDISLMRTDPSHFGEDINGVASSHVFVRKPAQVSVAGNTVDADVERQEFTQNSLHYMISLQMLNGRIKKLLGAITGK